MQVVQRVSDVFCEMMFEHGFVHCDPHPGPRRTGNARLPLLTAPSPPRKSVCARVRGCPGGIPPGNPGPRTVPTTHQTGANALLTQTLTYSLTHSLIHSLTHSLTRSLSFASITLGFGVVSFWAMRSSSNGGALHVVVGGECVRVCVRA